jgi:hypothetical protein
MAQFIRTPFIPNLINVQQVCQCSYHEERLFEIFWEQEFNRVLIQEHNEYFLLHSPDIQNITIFNVLQALGYDGEQVLVTWTENNQNDALLNSVVEQAALSQLSIYPANQPIPQNPYLGPLPMIAGQPRPVDEPDNNNDDDDNSTLPDTIVYRIVDHFGDSDDDNDNRYE